MGIFSSKAIDGPKVNVEEDVNDLLFLATQRNDFDAVKQYVARGGMPDNSIGAETGFTAFHICHNVNILKHLCLKRGIDDLDQIVDVKGHTPLHIAARQGRLDDCLALIEFGCLVDTENDAGRTPIQLAKTYCQHDCMLVLEQIMGSYCFCNTDPTEMLINFMNEYPNMSLVQQISSAVESNMETRRAEKEKQEKEKNRSEFSFEQLQQRSTEANRESGLLDEEDTGFQLNMQALKDISPEEMEEVPGLIRIKPLKENFRIRQLALHYRTGNCPKQRMRCKRCRATVTVGELDVHQSGPCGDANVMCPEGCRNLFPRSELEIHRLKCPARKSYPCPRGCGKVIDRGLDDVQHLKFHCPLRKKRCRYCKVYVVAKDWDFHFNSECVNRQVKCGVENCDTWFQHKYEGKKLARHENEHLQKRVQDWSPCELAFWFRRQFKYFNSQDLERYSKNIVESQVEGWQIVECEPGKLDAILKKRVGIGCVNQRGTVLQAFGSGLYGVTLKAGIFLNPYVAKKAVEDRFETARRPSHFKHVLARRKSPLLDVEKNTTKMARRANRRRSKGGMLIR
jgi:hypothetical protein